MATIILFTITFSYIIYLTICGYKLDGWSYFLGTAMFLISFAAMQIELWY